MPCDVVGERVEILLDPVEAQVEAVLAGGLLGLYEVLPVAPVAVDEVAREIRHAGRLLRREARHVVERRVVDAERRVAQVRADDLERVALRRHEVKLRRRVSSSRLPWMFVTLVISSPPALWLIPTATLVCRGGARGGSRGRSATLSRRAVARSRSLPVDVAAADRVSVDEHSGGVHVVEQVHQELVLPQR